MSGMALPHKLSTMEPLLLATEGSVIVVSPLELQRAVGCELSRTYFFCKVWI